MPTPSLTRGPRPLQRANDLHAHARKDTVERNGGLPCQLEEVIPAALRHGYRNKCEFSFGRDEHGAPCLGFQLGRIAVVGAVVGSPDACPNVRSPCACVPA